MTWSTDLSEADKLDRVFQMLPPRSFTFLVVLALFGWTAGPGFSQSDKTRRQEEAVRDKQRIRLQGKIVNFSAGDVSCRCAGALKPVHAGLEIADGDSIRISRGHAEILLNPGYYLRLGENTEISFVDLFPGNLKIRLLRGSAIVEIALTTWPTRFDEWQERFFNVLTVLTPPDEFAIGRGGAYRFDVLPDGRADVRVWKGRLGIPGRVLKDGTKASVFAGKVEISALEEKAGDDFDAWSRDRASALIKANKALRKREWFKQMNKGKAYLEVNDPEAAAASAANRMLSALLGAVEFAERGTAIMHVGSAWEEIKDDERLSDGDRLRTPPEARLELRPYPDFYLFLDGNTEIQYLENERGEVTVLVAHGTLNLIIPESEVSARLRNELILRAGNDEYRIRQSGYYRLDVVPNAPTELIIRHGSVKTSAQEIKSGKKAVSNEGGISVSSLDRRSLDSFDVWSEHRMARYVSPALRPARLRKLWSAAAWFYDETIKEFTFVPGGRPYKSPYGGEYSTVYAIDPPFRR